MRLLRQVQCSSFKKMTCFHKLIYFFDISFHNLVCLFFVPVPARASAHAWHGLAFVVSRFSAGNFADNKLLYPDNI